MQASCLHGGPHRPCHPSMAFRSRPRQSVRQRQLCRLSPPKTAAPDEVVLTQQPASPGNLSALAGPVNEWVRPPERTFTGPSIRESGTLRPAAEWYPAWMRYRRREDNYVFWRDKFMRCSLDIPGNRGLAAGGMAVDFLGIAEKVRPQQLQFSATTHVRPGLSYSNHV